MIDITVKKTLLPDIILLVLLPGLFLADLAHGVLLFNDIDLPVSLLSVVRGAVLIMAIVVVLRFTETINKRYLHTVLLLLALAIPGIIISLIRVNTPFEVYYEIKELSKVMYGPILVLMYLVLFDKVVLSDRKIISYIEYSAYLAGISLFTMQYLGLGYSTDVNDLWAKGFFSSQNDISLALALALCVAIYNNIVSPGPVRFVLMSLSLIGLALVGQRVALVSAFLIPVLVVAVLIFARSECWSGTKKRKFLIKVIPIAVIASISATYLVYQNIEKFSRPITKFMANLEGYGQRFQLYKVGLHQIEKRSTLENIVGEGATSYQHGIYKRYGLKPPGGFRLVEMDWMDLYGAYGAGFVVLIYLLLFYLLLRSLIEFLRYRDPATGIFVLMLGIYALHSVVVGHALSGPMPTSVIAPVIAMILIRRPNKLSSENRCTRHVANQIST